MSVFERRGAVVYLAPHHRGAFLPALDLSRKMSANPVPRSLRMENGTRGTGVRCFIALFLIPVLVGYPILNVYADEIAAESSVPPAIAPESASESHVESAPVPAEEVSRETKSASSENISEEDAAEASFPEDSVEEDVPVTATMPESASESPLESAPVVPEGGTGEVAGAATSTEEVVHKDTPPETGGGSVPPEEAQATTEETTSFDEATSTHEVIVVSESASSTDDIATEEEEAEVFPATEELDARVESHTEAAARAEEERTLREAAARTALRREIEQEFMKGCVTMDSTGYYCLRDDALHFSGDVRPSETIGVVTAETDGKGADKEIFATKGGKRIQLTDNDVDDAFPSTDLNGATVVWQGQVGDRWQVFFATIATNTPTITQLTNGTESNFNPRTDGGAVVWQGWADDNWEIFLAIPRPESVTPTGANAEVGVDGAWEVRRLTKNGSHDMFPSIAGEIVTWQSFDGANWVVVAYDIAADRSRLLSDGAKKAEKPRFALLWEERDEHGAARMMGLDVASGVTFDATAEAKRVPDGGDYPFPQAPVSAPDQSALPTSAGSVSTSTTQKDDEQ